MQQSQNFSVKPQGAVQKGSAAYQLDTVTGVIKYQGSVTAGVWLAAKTVTANDKIEVDPRLFLSSGMRTLGSTIALGPATFIAQQVSPTVTTVGVTIAPNIVGTAVLDTSAEILKVKQLVLKVPVPIFGTLTVEADDVDRIGFHAPKPFLKRLREYLCR